MEFFIFRIECILFQACRQTTFCFKFWQILWAFLSSDHPCQKLAPWEPPLSVSIKNARNFEKPMTSLVLAGCSRGIGAWDVHTSHNLTLDRFLPRLTPNERDVKFERWKEAVDRSMNWGVKPKPVTSDEQRLRASIPAAVFAFTSFIIWKIACSRS